MSSSSSCRASTPPPAGTTPVGTPGGSATPSRGSTPVGGMASRGSTPVSVPFSSRSKSPSPAPQQQSGPSVPPISTSSQHSSQFHVNSALNAIRLKVLMGHFNDYEASTWRPPQWKLLIFVSSTFTDTSYERNILMSTILPQLRTAGLRVGVEVTFVDMRWGVRDENTLDHRTWIECSRELERCRRESSGLFFLSLQSEK
jgi:hypothetical protein